MTTPILTIDQVHFSYNKTPLLKNISFTIKRNDFVGLIGPNGAGKTTLLKLMTGIFSPFKGQILFNNKMIHTIKRRELAQSMAVVSQELNPNIFFTVEELVSLGRYPYHKRPLASLTLKDKAFIEKIMKDTGLWSLKNQKKISCGERQLVYLAQALAQEPEILLLDEPTAHLDISHQLNIFHILKKINEEKQTTIFMIIHDLSLASHFCNQVILLKQGELFDQGNPKNILNEESIKKLFNIECVF